MKGGWEAGNRVRGWKVSSGGGQGRVLGETEAEGLSRERKNKRLSWMDGVFWGENWNVEDERCNQGCVACQEYTVGKDSLRRGWEG